MRSLLLMILLASATLAPAQDSAQPQAQARSNPSLHYLSKQCNEDAILMLLDPGPFQEYVGPRFPLVVENGKARVLVVVHDCPQYWMDGDDVGPTQELQVWVMIRGAEDVRPVIGAERTMPTRTWFSLFAGSSNPRVREAKAAAGMAQATIGSLSLDPPGPQRHGQASLSGDLKYSWQVPSPSAPQVRLLGLNHDVYTRDASGKIVLRRVQALVHVSAAPSTGTLKVEGRTDVMPLIPPGTYPATVQTFFPMWSRATLGLEPSP